MTVQRLHAMRTALRTYTCHPEARRRPRDLTIAICVTQMLGNHSIIEGSLTFVRDDIRRGICLLR